MISNLELILRILSSAIIGGIIGIEREAHNRPAGFRTHILVTMGATLIMLISTQGFPGMEGLYDPSRIAAQVVSGVGFLGAGTIIITGHEIKGLTTAASLWVCAGVGLAIGAGFYLGGLVTALIVFISLSVLSRLEKKMISRKYKVTNIVCRERPGLIGDLGQVFGKSGIMIKDLRINRNLVKDDSLQLTDTNGTEYDVIELEFTLMLNKAYNYDDFNEVLMNVHGVEQISWLN
jgi:putative Mg2+ transporter-C (MgtC) family protein